jgi:hypothetical protein
MRVILSKAKDLTYEAGVTHVGPCGQRSLCEVPRPLHGSG